MLPASRGQWAGAVALCVLAALAALGRRVTVEGASMEPALAPGDRLLFFPRLVLRPGDIVTLPDPRPPHRLLVKRIQSIDRRSRLVSVEGDNHQHSTDSRVFGPVDQRAIVGRAVYRYAPRGRAGPVERGR